MKDGGAPIPTRSPSGAAPASTRLTVQRTGLILAVVAAVGVVLFVGTRPLSGTTPAGPTASAGFYRIGAGTEGLGIGDVAPELGGAPGAGGTTLRGLDGQAVSLASLRGRPVWINFWATWCPPCQQETPDLRETFEAHRGDGLALVSIDVQEDPATVRAYAERYGLRYTVALDLTGSTVATYRVFGLPTHYFIDRDGIIRDRYFGPLTREQMEQRLAAIIKP